MPRILLVEDEADVRHVVEHVLVSEGYEVDAADKLKDGLALLDRRRYDLVLTDGRLPDGTEMALADIAEPMGVPALILTGYAFIRSFCASWRPTPESTACS